MLFWVFKWISKGVGRRFYFLLMWRVYFELRKTTDKYFSLNVTGLFFQLFTQESYIFFWKIFTILSCKYVDKVLYNSYFLRVSGVTGVTHFFQFQSSIGLFYLFICRFLNYTDKHIKDNFLYSNIISTRNYPSPRHLYILVIPLFFILLLIM